MRSDAETPGVLVKPVDDERDYYALDEDAPWELLDGRLVMAPASHRHEELFRFLLMLLGGWLDERGGGVVLGSRYPMRLDERWSPEPDLLVVTDAHADRMTSQRLEGPADLVIEIGSEGDRRFDERVKLPRYREARIPEIWLVSPRTGSVRVDRLQPDGDYRTVTLTEGRIDSAVLPGFWLDVTWLRQEPVPSTMACLRVLFA